MLGRSSVLTLTVTNTGGADLVLPTDALSITGADAGSFSLSADGCSAVTVAPQTSCDVSVNFAPASLGPKAAAVQVLSDAASSPDAVALSGTGVAPGFAAAPDQVGFGDQLVGTTSGQRTVTVTNTGTSGLTITRVAVVGAGAGQFSVRGQTCTAAVVAPKATCTVQVTFAAGSTGAKTAGLRFTSDAAGSPHTVGLRGTGVAPGFAAAPDPLAFGDQLVGTTSGQRTVTVTNDGTAGLSIGSVSLTGADAGLYAVGSQTCTAAVVAPNATCTVQVTFAAGSTGAKTAGLRFTSDAASSPDAVALSGTGVAPGFAAAPDPLAFGDQLVGTTSGQQTVTVTNTGTAGLTIGSVSLTGDDAGAFGVAMQSCTAAVVAPKATCTVQVTFAAGSTGAKTAGLRFTSDSGGSPHEVALSGNGVAPGLSAAPDPLAFGDQLVGTTSGQRTVTVTNTGTADLLLTAVTVAGDNASELIVGENTCVSAAIAASGTCTVQVAFAPSGPGAKTAVLALHGNAPGSPRMVTLSGNATEPPVQPTVSTRKQTLGTPLPKWIKLSGLTLVTPKGARTNAGQPVRTLITGGPRNPSAAKGRSFTIVRGPDGKTSIRTYGRPDLRFKVTQRAKPIAGYTAFKRTERYIGVKRR